MKIVQINTFSYKATGNIMMNIHRALCENGDESYVVWGRGSKTISQNEFSIYDKGSVVIHGIISRLFDRTGFGSTKQTKYLIKKLKGIRPDIIHLHNIHGYYINIELLFEYIYENNIKLVWTFHDCWPITGHCGYFDAIGCEKWKTGCFQCPQKKEYPKSILIDNSKSNWLDKKRIFSQTKSYIVTVSNWLEGIVNESFLKNNDIRTIYNGLNFDVFKPRHTDYKVKNGLVGKYIVLGVASEWNKRKGLDDFIELASRLGDSYKIILVGLSSKQISYLPSNIIGMQRTESQQELVELYTAADIFFNASVEETMGMTTLEAMACGTPSIVYNATALPEVMKGYPSLVAEKNDIDQVIRIIHSVIDNPFDKDELISYAKYFSNKRMTESYINLYKEIMSK